MKKNGKIVYCIVCAKEIYLIPSKEKIGEGKYCSRMCKGQAWVKKFSGANNPRWNNGVKYHAYGYRLIASPNHPYKDKQGYVREHRLIMEQMIGRYLFPNEDVHHLDSNKLNNDPKNLILCANRQEHLKLYHSEGGKKGWFGYR